MKFLFIHQNFPGQYRHLARALADDPRHQVIAIGKSTAPGLEGVKLYRYAPPRAVQPTTHHYMRRLEGGILHGQAVVRILDNLRRKGFMPDIICGHAGWGETLFIKDVYPEVPLLNYCEFFYHPTGADSNFAPGEVPTLDEICRTRINNTQHLISIEACNRGISPTYWQRKQFPEVFHSKIAVIHDGVDSDAAKPDPTAQLRLPNGKVLTASDEVVTYVARNFEPYRGFPTVMRAVSELCRRRPNAHFVMIGGDEVSYGKAPANGGTFREQMLLEVSVDPRRVHFLGKVPHAAFITALQISSAHMYLTVPFVLSWSVLEAMSAGCAVVGSATPPVQEVITDGENGLLVDFFSHSELADRVIEVLNGGERIKKMRENARRTVCERYALKHCLPAQLSLLAELAGVESLISPPAKELMQAG